MSGARRSLLGRLSLRYLGPEARCLGPEARCLGPEARCLGPEARCLGPVRRFLAGHEARLASSGEHGPPGWVAPGRLAGRVSRPVCHALPYLRRMACRMRRLRAAAVMAAAGTLVLACGCSSGAGSAPARRSAVPAASAAVTGCRHQYASACFTPQQLRVAYGFQPLLDRGTDGRGQTVVLMEFASTPPRPPSPLVTDIRQDLALFDAVFGLPAARLQVDASLAGSAWPWLAGLEEVEDAEIVHAIAPDAAIRVILIPPWTGPGSWIAAVDGVLRLALSQGSVVSFSAILGEECFTPAEAAGLNAALQADQEHHVTVVASSGDFGAASTHCADFGLPTSVREVGLPASDPLVLAAGGTTLDADPATGAYRSETAWHTPPGTANPQTSGGGFSHLFARPAYQDGVAGIGATRGVPDVAADAAGSTGMTLAVSTGAGQDYFYPGAGTSAATPLWAALIALADQYVGRHLGFVNPAIYRIGRGASYHQAFHDITTGNSTVTFPQGTITGYRASPGWDPVTGWGSPDAQVLIPLLARYASP
jgi:subtilase family serine protease